MVRETSSHLKMEILRHETNENSFRFVPLLRISIVDHQGLLRFLVTFIRMNVTLTKEDLPGFSFIIALYSTVSVFLFALVSTGDNRWDEHGKDNIQSIPRKISIITGLLFQDHCLTEHDCDHLHSPLYTTMNKFILGSIVSLVFSNPERVYSREKDLTNDGNTGVNQRSADLRIDTISLLFLCIFSMLCPHLDHWNRWVQLLFSNDQWRTWRKRRVNEWRGRWSLDGRNPRRQWPMPASSFRSRKKWIISFFFLKTWRGWVQTYQHVHVLFHFGAEVEPQHQHGNDRGPERWFVLHFRLFFVFHSKIRQSHRFDWLTPLTKW